MTTAPVLDYATAETAPAWILDRVDGCTNPACPVGAASPDLWAITGKASEILVCTYQCACQAAWWTSWHIPSLGVVATG